MKEENIIREHGQRSDTCLSSCFDILLEHEPKLGNAKCSRYYLVEQICYASRVDSPLFFMLSYAKKGELVSRYAIFNCLTLWYANQITSLLLCTKQIYDFMLCLKKSTNSLLYDMNSLSSSCYAKVKIYSLMVC